MLFTSQVSKASPEHTGDRAHGARALDFSLQQFLKFEALNLTRKAQVRAACSVSVAGSSELAVEDGSDDGALAVEVGTDGGALAVEVGTDGGDLLVMGSRGAGGTRRGRAPEMGARRFPSKRRRWGPSGVVRGGCRGPSRAARDGEIARMIMEKRPGLARESDREACTPVTDAVLYGKIDILKVMLEHDSTLGYEINSKGRSLLTAAANRGQVGAAQVLLKHCPDAPCIDDTDGMTVLHIALWFDQEEFVEFVLKTPLLRKIVNMPDNNGETALHLAVRKCNPKMVAALLSHEDIDATVLDNSGYSASWNLRVSRAMQQAKTLNWNKVIMLMLRACPQDASKLRNLHVSVKQQTTEASRKNAKSLTKTYTSNTSLVAILISTITFAAAFTLPGGYSNDVGSEGQPIMSKKFAFQVFLISDVLALCSSFSIAFICIIARWEDYEFLIYYRSFTKKLMWFAYVATITAFSTGLYTVLAPRLHWLAIATCVLVALLPIITWLLGEWPVLKLRYQLGKSFNSDLLDMV